MAQFTACGTRSGGEIWPSPRASVRPASGPPLRGRATSAGSVAPDESLFHLLLLQRRRRTAWAGSPPRFRAWPSGHPRPRKRSSDATPTRAFPSRPTSRCTARRHRPEALACVKSRAHPLTRAARSWSCWRPPPGTTGGATRCLTPCAASPPAWAGGLLPSAWCDATPFLRHAHPPPPVLAVTLYVTGHSDRLIWTRTSAESWPPCRRCDTRWMR